MKRIEVLAIGDELLDGRVADTNTLRIAVALAPLGLEIAQRTTVRDVVADIVREGQAVIARGTTLCIVSGGLGPTTDDLTAEALAQLAGVPLERDPSAVERITELLRRRGREVLANQLRQADRPRGSDRVDNPVGTAPGFALAIGGCRFVSLPGVPRELDAMLPSVLAPLVAAARPLARRVLKTFGLIESEVDGRLAPLATSSPRVRVGYRAKFPEVHVSLTAPPELTLELAAAEEQVRAALGNHVFTDTDDTLASVLVGMLRDREATLATAESCTGGLVADLVTDVPGASEVFAGGVSAYSNATKTALLGVPEATLARDGAVSEAAVRAMAAGARQRLGSTYAIAVSGIAGPSGGTPEKPVGTVWLAVDGPHGASTRKLQLPFDRRGNKVASAYAALDLLRRTLLAG